MSRSLSQQNRGYGYNVVFFDEYVQTIIASGCESTKIKNSKAPESLLYPLCLLSYAPICFSQARSHVYSNR